MLLTPVGVSAPHTRCHLGPPLPQCPVHCPWLPQWLHQPCRCHSSPASCTRRHNKQAGSVQPQFAHRMGKQPCTLPTNMHSTAHTPSGVTTATAEHGMEEWHSTAEHESTCVTQQGHTSVPHLAPELRVACDGVIIVVNAHQLRLIHRNGLVKTCASVALQVLTVAIRPVQTSQSTHNKSVIRQPWTRACLRVGQHSCVARHDHTDSQVTCRVYKLAQQRNMLHTPGLNPLQLQRTQQAKQTSANASLITLRLSHTNHRHN